MADEEKENIPNECENEIKNNDEDYDENETFDEEEEEENDFENNFYNENQENMNDNNDIDTESSIRRLERMLEYFIENEVEDSIFEIENNRRLSENYSLIYSSSISRNNNNTIFIPNRSTISERYYTNNIFNNNLLVDSFYDSVINSVINESFEEQPIPEKINDALELKVLIYDEISDKEKDKECSICLSEFEKESKVSLITCNHLFHNDCIREWSMYKQNCPICRKKIE
jgi:hypothetical protein